MEVKFRFYNNTTHQQEIKSMPFDTRSGLDNLMIGLDWSEIETNDRLLHQLENVLSIDLSFLDYWDEKVHENIWK